MASLMILNINQSQPQTSDQLNSARSSHATNSSISPSSSSKSKHSYNIDSHPQRVQSHSQQSQQSTPAATLLISPTANYEKLASSDVKPTKFDASTASNDKALRNAPRTSYITSLSLANNSDSSQHADNKVKNSGLKPPLAESNTHSYSPDCHDNCHSTIKQKRIKYHYRNNQSNLLIFFFRGLKK